MGFKKFLASIIKNLAIIVVVTLLFSTVNFERPELLKSVFQDIFEYADPEAQKQAVSKLTEACSSLDNTESSSSKDFKIIGSLCKDYNSGKIDDKEFFISVISGTIASQAQLSNSGFLSKYNGIVGYLNKNKIIYFSILSVSMLLLYLLIRDLKLFILALTRISFSIGILVTLPYIIVLAYDKFVGIDTTTLLGSIFGQVSFDPRAIISVILLLFLRTYNKFVIIIGILFLTIGIFGKVYSIFSRKKAKKELKKDEAFKTGLGESEKKSKRKKKK